MFMSWVLLFWGCGLSVDCYSCNEGLVSCAEFFVLVIFMFL